ncbi:hypothetical protein F2Q68_00037611 [Brassica cretica]|uniref:FKB95-like N-terminal Kelch domain-containing protein n=1 Tax=Brassica cretica TaxID=69181 RepID=A0A8S9H5E4_BRACR|nr:hypothetical protein F2Q68_00037611 [Brassica cretica]
MRKYIDKYNANWIEVFDLKTQSWTSLPGPGADDVELRNHLRKYSEYFKVNEFKGKLYVATDEKEFSYEPNNGAWKFVRETSSAITDSMEVSCDMRNVIYSCTDSGYLMWREIKGLRKLREHPTRGLKTGSDVGLVVSGGQLLVMWDPYIKRSNKIRYAEISLESRRNGRELWGKVECVDVLTFPVESYEWFGCVAASV